MCSKNGDMFNINTTIASDYIAFSDYQEFVRDTDQNKNTGAKGIHLPFLGLFGEVGSLLSELKKKQRDSDSYIGYEESVMEEFGDVMWYFTAIANHASLNINILAQRMSRDIDDWDNVEDYKFGTFGSIQSLGNHIGPVSNDKFEQGIIALAGKVGKLLDEVAIGRVKSNRDVISAHLVEIFRAIVQAAADADISLDEVVRGNINKVSSRYPIKPEYTPLFDDDFDVDEQIPRRFEILIEEVKINKRPFVIQKCNGIKIGDRLTDNKLENDDYRFHDVFHLAYAAILGWSPVIRSLFKMKRKSRPETDENEDGARAILIEEGVATWIFNHGVRLKYYENIDSLDYALLKAVKELVKGYEVEACSLWQWERAILEGFSIFRFLKKHRKGKVIVDLNTRSIVVEPIDV